MQDYPLTVLILAGTIVVSLLSWRQTAWLELLMLDTQSVLRRGQWFRTLSSGLIHADMAHLAFNMFSLWSFGSILEQVYGPWAMLGPHLAGILGGSLLAVYFHRHEAYRALGASGGVCGVIFASVMLFPGGSVMIFPVPIPIPSEIYAFGFLIVTWFGMRRGTGGIGHDAHFGGAIIGILTAAALFPGAVMDRLGLFLGILGLASALFVMSIRQSTQRRGG